jgi:predicted nucleic acid-binding protein
MNDGRVLIDTGAIYAFITRTDKHHREAIAFVKNWLKRGGAFVLPDMVFAETMTLLWALFQKYDDKDWSYTDCATLALARRLNIGKVFSFDHHFSQMPGVARVP